MIQKYIQFNENLKKDTQQEELNKKLLVACKNQKLTYVKKLISQGADINFQCDHILNPDIHIEHFITPLMISCWNEDTQLLTYLLSIGANIEMKDEDGETCFAYGNTKWQKYNIQKLIMNNYPNGYGILKKHDIKIHPDIKKEYPEAEISDELGFFS